MKRAVSERSIMRYAAVAAIALCLPGSVFFGGCAGGEQLRELIIPQSLFGYMRAPEASGMTEGRTSREWIGVAGETDMEGIRVRERSDIQATRVPEAGDYEFVIIWTGGGSLAAGYNVYRKIGTGSFEKLNSALVQPGRIGDGPSAAMGFTFTDTTVDRSSTSEHAYYVTAEDATGLETPPSGLISCVPAAFDSNASVAGLAPDTTSDVGVVPVFNWAPIARAASYCVFLMDGGSGDAGSVIWVRRVGQPPLTYKSTEGITYADAGGDALAEGAEYTWLVLAIDSRNWAFAVGEASFSTSAPGKVPIREAR